MTLQSLTHSILKILRLHELSAGLEVSDTAIRYVLPVGGSWNVFSVPIAPGVMEHGIIRDAQAYTQSLRTLHDQIVRTATAKRLPVVVCLSTYPVYSQIIKVPLLNASDLNQAIALNIAMLTPKDREVYASHQIVATNDQEGFVESLVAFIDQSVIQQHTTAFLSAGFLPTAVEWQAYSLTRFVVKTVVARNPALLEGVFAVITVDDVGIRAALIRKGMLYFDYRVSWHDVARSAAVVTREMVASAVQDTVTRLIRYGQQHLALPTLDYIYVNAPTVSELVQRAVAGVTSIPSSALADESVVVDGSLYASGASLREAGQESYINLIGKQFVSDVRTVTLINFLHLWQFVVPVLFAVLLLVGMGQDIYTLRTKNELQLEFSRTYNQELSSQLRAYVAQTQNFNALVDTALASGVTAPKKSPLLDAFVRIALSANVGIVSYVASGDVVTVQATARTQDEAVAFERTLQSNSQFSGVSVPLSSIRAMPSGVSFAVSFSSAAKQ